MPLEIEIKFNVADPARIRRRLLSLGAASEGRAFEHNVRFEDRDGSLQKAGRLLRLRRDRRARLTFKSSKPESDGQFKVHRELEVEVDDFNRTRKLLQALGFRPVQRYEKWRETLRLENTEFCLDSLPYGEFLEIEGAPESIRSFVDRLGLRWEQRILQNYLQIFELVRLQKGLAFSDLTFDNFKGIRVDQAWLARKLEAGT